MNVERKAEVLRVVCWLVVVILPTAAVCVFFRIKDIRIVAVALPFILIAERVYRKWLQKAGLWGPDNSDDKTKRPNEGEHAGGG